LKLTKEIEEYVSRFMASAGEITILVDEEKRSSLSLDRYNAENIPGGIDLYKL
jgi:hypothetical protein